MWSPTRLPLFRHPVPPNKYSIAPRSVSSPQLFVDGILGCTSPNAFIVRHKILPWWAMDQSAEELQYIACLSRVPAIPRPISSMPRSRAPVHLGAPVYFTRALSLLGELAPEFSLPVPFLLLSLNRRRVLHNKMLYDTVYRHYSPVVEESDLLIRFSPR